MLFRRLLALALLALVPLLHVPAPALAAQGTGCMPTTGIVSGLTFAQDVNAGIAALISSNSGSSAPATDCTAVAIVGQLWLDTSTTPSVLKIYAGSNGWVKIGAVDNTNTVWTPPIGGGNFSLASAGTTSLCSVPQAQGTVSGTTTITALGTGCSAGQVKIVYFSGALTLTYNATSLITPTAANIVTVAGDQAILVSLGGSNWRVVDYSRADGTPIGVSTASSSAQLDAIGSTRGSVLYRGASAWSPLTPGTAGFVLTSNGSGADPSYVAAGAWALGTLNGCTLSRATATTFGITACYATNEDGGTTFNMSQASAFTKSLSAWAAASGNGGLDTGSIAASTWYHVHEIRKTSDGSIDYLLSLSPTAPTMPSGYVARRRIGSILTNGSSQIVAFIQNGNTFTWDIPLSEVNVTNPGTAAVTKALTVPTGVAVYPIMAWALQNVSSANFNILVSPLSITDTTPSSTLYTLTSAATNQASNSTISTIPTNTSGQIRYRASVSGASDVVKEMTVGWIDTRGQ